MTTHPRNSGFARALSAEIVASERLRARVLAILLCVLLVVELGAFTYLSEVRAQLARPVSRFLPLYVLGPFLAYECLVLLALGYLAARGREPPRFVRFVNATIETSLPTVIIYIVSHLATPDAAFGTWPSLFYFVFIVASTLRLNFALPMYTGAVAATEYLVLAAALLPLSVDATQPVLTPQFHIGKAAVMLITGLVAGLVALRLRAKFIHAMTEGQARERVTNLFGQHVSPAVVERLLGRGENEAGDLREVCVMFLDIRDFTVHARERRPPEVVDYLNEAFAFMIAAVDRHNGIINKFLGDGFMAVFGAPLDDPKAVHHAVAAAREILDEIDRRSAGAQGNGRWPLRVGIGVHVGRAVTGNVGSPQRKEFTVIGDVVNLASRLEQLNKEYGSRLLVSEAVMAALPDGVDGARPLGDVAVKSYAEPIRVWRLDG